MIIKFIEPQEAGTHLTKPIHTSMLYCSFFVGCRGYVLSHKPARELTDYIYSSWLITARITRDFTYPHGVVIFPSQKDTIILKSRRVEC